MLKPFKTKILQSFQPFCRHGQNGLGLKYKNYLKLIYYKGFDDFVSVDKIVGCLKQIEMIMKENIIKKRKKTSI